MANPPCVCMDGPLKDGNNYVVWMAEIFGDCAYSSSERWAFALGLASTLVWLVAQAPQIFKNFKLKQVDGISGAFLATWLSGDVTNLLGCITTSAFKTQLYSAVYFCTVDIILLSQYTYYQYIYPSQPEPIETFHIEETEKCKDGSKVTYYAQGNNAKPATVTKRMSLLACILVAAGLLIGIVTWNANRASGEAGTNEAGIPYCDAEPQQPEWEKILGIVFSWMSGSLYFFSRVPQLIQNYHRKTVHGLSIIMFGLAITANMLYGFSILFKQPTIDAEFWGSKFPFLVGSLGTLIFDASIMVQTYLYGWAPPVEDSSSVETDAMTAVETEVNCSLKN